MTIPNRNRAIQISRADVAMRRAKPSDKYKANQKRCTLCDRPSGEHFAAVKSKNRWCPKPGGGFLNTKYTTQANSQ